MIEPNRFPDATILQLQNESLRVSVAVWRSAFHSARRGGLWSAVPGLLCAVGVFTVPDVPLWVNGLAGATVAGSVTVLAMFWVGYRSERRERLVDAALAARLFKQMGDRE